MKPEKKNNKCVIVFFDLEWRKRFDLNKAMKRIIKILDKNDIKTVFNTCGTVVENYPKLIKRMYTDGHEIASHGYAHENFIQLKEVGQLDDVLTKTERLIENATGERPVGIRSPWFHSDKGVYSTIEKRGYKWISDNNILRTEILKKPHVKFGTMRYLFFNLLWRRYKKEPFKKGSILEIPLLSSQDGELFGLLDPSQETPEDILDFAYQTLKTQFDKSGKVFNLNFHPWLIGTSNRVSVLEKILDYINQKKSEFVLAKELVDHYD
jgi:peptidoglycan/xylan/chitin deacetylase (PgdA/CDA1 family)